ncbi:hypothetical protein L5515_010786 [Caenorhabditis briggsae]|uniref:Uncharacterized protein n=1 Tax=Caenorhabditis briggsae TaxID=6238 RepID=A0AAE9ER85_CAEBR|nr:hypothetical protein L5515_010786 [Caenorhabditis briggsae]
MPRETRTIKCSIFSNKLCSGNACAPCIVPDDDVITSPSFLPPSTATDSSLQLIVFWILFFFILFTTMLQLYVKVLRCNVAVCRIFKDISGAEGFYGSLQWIVEIDPQARGADVPSTYCEEKANCVTLIEELKIGTGARGYIRGCWGSVLLFGFNRTGTVGALAEHSFCHTFNLTQLVSGGRPEESSINVCSCRGSLCNGSTINASSTIFSFSHFLLAILIVILKSLN